MLKRILGKSNLEVSALGLGCMGMSMGYGKSDDAQSMKTIQYAINQGITFIDTADVYGDGHNEKLIGKILSQNNRNKIVLATKCGFSKSADDQFCINASPDYIKKSCENSLRRLGVDVIDLYYLHRADRNIPIEESMLALSDLVKSGKICHIGLSEVTAKTLHRAAAIHPITALQSEYSLWHRKPEKEILNACKELGIGFVPYSPLGRGFLTSKIQDINTLESHDFRRNLLPKFQAENMQKNLKLVKIIENIAQRKNCTPAQLALAWILAQGKDIVPIPGTRSITRLDENIACLDVKLSETELTEINQLIPIDAAAGEQYPEALNFEV